MASLDVTSLFTCVPLWDTINYLCDCIMVNEINIGIPLASLKELLLHCTFNFQFSFNGELYRQTDGVAMGSPLGPLLADIFVAKLENQELQDTIEGLPFYCRYADDIFILVDDNIPL
ncbi:unnamed protein product [Echinostoma caproni]|uniref:Reverse transcriptase domain-containing protein n=1 Tax=Echinostoma caproni TaxID=27848 RepID=A0A183AP70_9TREM|nr:unnamed protein product [Echinostoma caproni]